MKEIEDAIQAGLKCIDKLGWNRNGLQYEDVKEALRACAESMLSTNIGTCTEHNYRERHCDQCIEEAEAKGLKQGEKNIGIARLDSFKDGHAKGRADALKSINFICPYCKEKGTFTQVELRSSEKID